MTTPPPDKQPAAETLEQIANRICRHYLDSERVSVTQFCDIEAAILSALRSERERCARAICLFCAEPGHYGPPREIEGSKRLWHADLRNDCNGVVQCQAVAIREGK